MRWNKMGAVLAGVVFTAFAATAVIDVQAATVDDGKAISYVGRTITTSDVSGLKINNKATSKFKKKIKTVKTGQNAQTDTYRTKSYFDTEDAYASTNAYDAENGSQTYKYYPASADYQLTFKKAGTYKVSYTESSLERYDEDYDHYDSVTGKSVYKIEKYNSVTDEWEQITTAAYISEGVQAEEDFYQGANGTKYAYGNQGLVPASLAKGADGKVHVKYQAKKLEKTTHTKTYKVLKAGGVVKSVKLGKSTNKSSVSYTEGSTSVSVKKGKFLSGNSGKVTVTMADKNYGLTSILVRTYDEGGNPVYAKVGNKKTATYGNYLYHRESTPESTHKYYSSSMYKPTEVLVFYKNKFTGESTTVSNVSKDAQGNDTYVITQTYTSRNPSTNKEIILKRTYNITKKKPYADADYYEYGYTENYQSWNPSTKKYEPQKDSGSRYSLESFLDDYTVSTFYKK